MSWPGDVGRLQHVYAEPLQSFETTRGERASSALILLALSNRTRASSGRKDMRRAPSPVRSKRQTERSRNRGAFGRRVYGRTSRLVDSLPRRGTTSFMA